MAIYGNMVGSSGGILGKTKTYVDDKVASLVNSAPETLDTLNELAAALGNDANFATTVATQIGSKVDKVDGKSLSTNDFTDTYKAQLDNMVSITNDQIDAICAE